MARKQAEPKKKPTVPEKQPRPAPAPPPPEEDDDLDDEEGDDDEDDDDDEDGPEGISSASPSTPMSAASGLAAALDDIVEDDEEDDEDALPDAEHRGGGAPRMPGTEIEPEFEERGKRPSNATVARELSGFKEYIGDAQKISIYHTDDLGSQNLVRQYKSAEIEPYGSVELFVQRVIVPKYGPGTYRVLGHSANNKKYELESVKIAAPVVDEKERGVMQVTQELMSRNEQLTDRLLVAQTRQPEPQDPIALMERIEDFKKRSGGGDPMQAMLMMKMLGGPDPALGQLTSLVTQLISKMERLEERVNAPPPPPVSSEPDPTFQLMLEMIRSDRNRPSPFAELASIKQIFAPAEQLPLRELIAILQAKPTPLLETIEQMRLLKSVTGEADANPFMGIVKMFFQSPLANTAAQAIGEAMRQRSGGAPAGAPQLPAPAEHPFPEGYIEKHSQKLSAAKDDSERVQALVGAILELNSDPNWERLAAEFFEAVITDRLADVNKLLIRLFEFWRKRGGTLSVDSGDQVIRAVSVGWDLIVQHICGAAKRPVPESLTQRIRTATANTPAPTPPAPPTAAPVQAAPAPVADVIPINRTPAAPVEPQPETTA